MPEIEPKDLLSHGSHLFGDTAWSDYHAARLKDLAFPLLRHTSLASSQETEDRNTWYYTMRKMSACPRNC